MDGDGIIIAILMTMAILFLSIRSLFLNYICKEENQNEPQNHN